MKRPLLLSYSSSPNKTVGVTLPRLMLWALMLATFSLILWAYFATVDQVTRARGSLISAARTQLIQSADGGVITVMHVTEGQSVSKGQALVTLQKERALAALSDTRAKFAAAKANIARLEAEIFGREILFPQDVLEFDEYVKNQQELYFRRKKLLQEDVASLEAMLKLVEHELTIQESLLKTGDTSLVEVLRLRRSAADIKSQMLNKRNKYFQDAQAEMTKASEELATLQEQLRDRQQLLEHTELVAPADGVVNNIRATTPGAVIRPGEVVLELFPTNSDLIAEVKVPPVDIAYVTNDQEALVRIDAFDPSIYGGFLGKVVYVSPDVLKEETKEGLVSYYRVNVLIKEAEFRQSSHRKMELRPGMSVEVDIKAQERSVLNYIMKPIIKTLDRSLGER